MRRLACVALMAGCAGNPNGLEAWLRVDGATYVRGATPAAADGPAISSFVITSGRVVPGQKSKPLSGLVPRETRAIALFLDGDVGHWLITPGAVDPQGLDQLGFSARLSFSPLLPEGHFTLVGRAVDAAGRFGARAEADLQTASLPPDGARLEVALSWDTQADLDLHLAMPDGAIVWAKNVNSNDPTANPNGWPDGAILDFDSNANCQIDGLRRETARSTAPASGHYIARVDAFSLCGEAQADWTLTVTLDGTRLGTATGFLRDRDTAYPHDAAAGVTALAFDVP
jgi:hypothetical protein